LTPLERGLLAFRRGRFWHAHEEWEEDWQSTRDPVVRGMIQLAAALFHVRQGNAAGAARVYARAARLLEGAAPGHRGLPVERVLPLAEYVDLSLDAAREFLYEPGQ
jgi:predicted metal-dependent hydrolase